MSKKVLVVDDVATLRCEIVYLLEDEGYEPFQAENGKLAIDVLNGECIDLLITDVMMPEMDGIELSEYCMQHFPELKIIIISGGGTLDLAGSSGDLLTDISNRSIADAILKKPFNYDELHSHIVRLIG